MFVAGKKVAAVADAAGLSPDSRSERRNDSI
jgi:hypothetical protein